MEDYGVVAGRAGEDVVRERLSELLGFWVMAGLGVVMVADELGTPFCSSQCVDIMIYDDE